MPAYHLILQDDADHEPRRIDFDAECIDQAFQIARNQVQRSSVELWEGPTCHVRLINGGSHLWKLQARGSQPDTRARSIDMSAPTTGAVPV